MEFRDVIRRRMVRHFSEEPIAPEALERIVEAAQRAPSAGFSQGQRLVVVTEPERRRRVAELVGEAEYVAGGFDPWLSRCGAQFIPFVSESVYHRRYREPDKVREDGSEIDRPIPYWWLDVGCTTMLILLAAADEGPAAGFAGVFDPAALRPELGAPEEFVPVGVIPVGHALPDRRWPSLRRGWLPRERFAHRERW